MMQTESKHLIAVVGIKLAAGMELKKNEKVVSNFNYVR